MQKCGILPGLVSSEESSSCCAAATSTLFDMSFLTEIPEKLPRPSKHILGSQAELLCFESTCATLTSVISYIQATIDPSNNCSSFKDICCPCCDCISLHRTTAYIPVCKYSSLVCANICNMQETAMVMTSKATQKTRSWGNKRLWNNKINHKNAGGK